MATPPPPEPESTLERIMEERRAKARALTEAGSHPYRNDIGPKMSIGAVRARYEPTRPAPPAPKEPKGARPEEPQARTREKPAPKEKAAPIAPIDGEPL